MRVFYLAFALAAITFSGTVAFAQENVVSESNGNELYFSDTEDSGTYVKIDGLLMHRVGAGFRQVLAIDTNLPPGANTVLQTTDLRFDLTPGAQVFVGWRPQNCCQCSSFEVGYFGLFDSQASSTVTGPNNLAIPGALGQASNNFLLTDVITANYGSSLHSLEFNCVKSCCFDDYTQLDVLAGFRYLRLDEEFDLIATDFQEGTGTYHLTTANDLFGVQVGGRVTQGYQNWMLQLDGRAGVFVNAARQSQIITDAPLNPGPFLLRARVGDSGSAVATVAQLGFTAIRPINDTWSFRIGYMALGIGGVALATDQLDFTDNFLSGTNLNANGFAFYHGAVAGVQATW